MGFAHATSIYENKIANAQLSAICDIDIKKKNLVSEKFGDIPFYDDARKLFESKIIDAVIIATPHKFHADLAIKALENDIHILVEKPVDITVSAANRLNDIANRSGKVFAVMFNQRTNPLFRKAHDLVHSGAIGELKRSVWVVTNWYRTQCYYDSGDWRATWSGEGGGVLLNQAPHNLDLWQWICGMPQTVTAFCEFGRYHHISVEDDVTLITRYKNGAVGVFITSTGEFPGTNRLEISGNFGRIVLEDCKLKLWKLSENERDFCFSSKNGFDSIPYEYEEYTDEDSGDAHIGIINNFIDSILNGTELISPGIEAINELSISNAAYLSAWQGNKEISIPFDTKQFDALLLEHSNDSKHINTERKEQPNGNYRERWNVRWQR